MLRPCTVLSLLLAASCAGPEVHHYYDHLDSLDIWEPKALRVPVGGRSDPSWEVLPIDDPVAEGLESIAVFIDGERHPGDVWIERSLHFLESGGPLRVTLRFKVFSPEERVQPLAEALAFVGRQPPREATRFTARPLDQVEGWLDYAHTVETRPGPAGRLWFAIGVRPAQVGEHVYVIDDVRIEIEPLLDE